MRLEVTRRADLAVRALVALARQNGRLKAGALAAALDTTAGFVPQVMGPLVRAGWVHSEPGPSGGYALGTALDQLSVLQVVEEIDGPTDTGRCVVANRPCDDQHPCALHAAWSRARDELLASLAAMSLASLAEDRA